MAQTGYTPIQLYHSTTALSVPLAADLRTGELAINVADGKLYYKDSGGAVQLLTSAGSGGGTVTSVAGTGTVNGLTLTGTVTSTGSLTLGGTLSNVNLATQVTGNLQVANLNGGSGASSATFWRGDGTWATPAGSGGGVTAVNAAFPITVTGTTSPTIGIASSVGNPVTTTTGSGALTFSVSPTLVTPNLVAPNLGQPLTGNFSTGTFTWPTFNQNTTGSSASCTGNAATATSPSSGGSFITTSNISAQAVSYANNAGNAGTVTNGVYTVGNQSISGDKTFTGYINVGSTANPIFQTGAGALNLGAGLVTNNSGTIPTNDNTSNLGFTSNRWAQVYAVNGTINTSDASQKQQIADFTAAEIAVGKRLRGLFKTYKMNEAVAKKGAAARIHAGVMAQAVFDAFAAEGLDANKYSLYCTDTWVDSNGVTQTLCGIRYDELFAFILGSL